MGNEMSIFNHENFGSVRVFEKDGELWFVANDICSALGIVDSRKSVALLDKDDRNSMPIMDKIGRSQDTNIVNESGMYSLILRSRKPEAKKFRKWVTSDVLPSIRKTGSYSIDKPAPVKEQSIYDMMRFNIDRLEEIDKKMSDHESRLGSIEEVQSKKVDLQKALPTVPDIKTRGNVNSIVRSYANQTGTPIGVIWKRLYSEFTSRYSINLLVRGKNRSMTGVGYAEKNGYIDDLFATAIEIFA